MDMARARANEAGEETPIGASLFLNGKLVTSAHNECIALKDPTAHAEVLVLRRGAELMGSWNALRNGIVYTTQVPCNMCAGAMLNAEIALCVYDNENKVWGCDKFFYAQRGLLITKHSTF
jgi:tRNA(adenine34) deaminase